MAAVVGSAIPFLDINVIGASAPIAYRTVLKGEVTYSAEIGYFLPPKPWWQGAGLVVMGYGIYIELIGGVVILVGGSALVIFLRHRARERKLRT
jgi:hypothetical protein